MSTQAKDKSLQSERFHQIKSLFVITSACVTQTYTNHHQETLSLLSLSLQCSRSLRTPVPALSSLKSSRLCRMSSSATAAATCSPETTWLPKSGTSTWRASPWRRTRCVSDPGEIWETSLLPMCSLRLCHNVTSTCCFPDILYYFIFWYLGLWIPKTFPCDCFGTIWTEKKIWIILVLSFLVAKFLPPAVSWWLTVLLLKAGHCLFECA